MSKKTEKEKFLSENAKDLFADIGYGFLDGEESTQISVIETQIETYFEKYKALHRRISLGERKILSYIIPIKSLGMSLKERSKRCDDFSVATERMRHKADKIWPQVLSAIKCLFDFYDITYGLKVFYGGVFGDKPLIISVNNFGFQWAMERDDERMG